MKSERFIIVVAGMHRSGTSAMTRVLGLSGCDLPAHLLGASDSNEAGHWESAPMVAFNDTLLESAGSDWEDWARISEDWFASAKADQFKAPALSLLEEEFGASRLMVVKDPRICRLLPFWLDVMSDNGYTPRLIVPLRNPLEVAQSIAARNGIDPYYNQLLWLRHVLQAEADSRGVKRFFCSYDELLNDWQGLLNRAGRSLGVSWPRRSAKVSDEIDAFLAPHLRHHSLPDPTRSESDAVLEWVKIAYGVLRRWGETDEDEEGKVALDAVRAELDAGVRNFGRLIYRGQKSSKAAAELRQTSHVLEVEVVRLQELERELHGAIAGKDKEIRSSLERIEGYEQRDQALSAEVTRLQELADALHSAIGQKDEEIHSRLARIDEYERRERELRVDVDHLHSAMGQKDEEIHAGLARIDEYERREGELRVDVNHLHSAIGQKDEEIHAGLARIDEYERRERELRVEVSRLQELERVLHSAIGQKDQEINASLARVAEFDKALGEGRAEIARLSEVEGELRAQVTEATIREADLDNVVQELTKSLAKAEENLRQRAAAVVDAEARIVGEAQIRVQFEQIIRTLTDYNESLEADLRAEQNRAADAEQAWLAREAELSIVVEDFENRLSHTESAMRQKAAQADDFAREVAELQKANGELSADLQAVRRQLDTEKLISDDQYEERQREVIALQAHVDMLESTVATLREAKRSLDLKKENVDRLLRVFSSQKRFSLLKKLEMRRMAAVLKESGLVDGEWYRKAYDDVGSSGADPYVHYLQFGVREGRLPMPPDDA